MYALRHFAAFIDGMNARIGKLLSVLVWFIAIICAIVVGMRYIFHITFTWMQELYIAIHAVVFLAGASFAMLVDAHVRVDILKAKWTVRKRAAVEIIGALLFTLPWLITLTCLTWPFVLGSWSILESSSQPNGLSGVFLVKSMLIVFCLLMILQCLAVIARGILVLCGDEDAAQTAPFAKSEA